MDRETIIMKNTTTIVKNGFFDTTDLSDNEIMLRLKRTCNADPLKEWVPGYYFDICLTDGTEIGYCDLRIGYNNKIYIGVTSVMASTNHIVDIGPVRRVTGLSDHGEGK